MKIVLVLFTKLFSPVAIVRVVPFTKLFSPVAIVLVVLFTKLFSPVAIVLLLLALFTKLLYCVLVSAGSVFFVDAVFDI